MPTLNLKSTHKPVKAYYESLDQFDRLGVTHETAVRSAFQSLLESCGKQFDWTLVPEHPMALNRNKRIVVDGALIDDFRLPHGYWEAKDIHDDLPTEVQRKFEAGYPTDNILFQTPQRAILYQDDRRVIDADLTDPKQLIETLQTFFAHRPQEISEWDIFHYIYGLLHHPDYRERYQANLKRELPHLPFTPNFWRFAKAGQRLSEIHVGYEGLPEYRLEFIETPDMPLNWRVEKMRFSKDKTQIVYNDFLTLGGIPPEALAYRLGNRSALEWIIDQYRVKEDKRSGIVNDPNRDDDPQYIVKLIQKVITVSLETMEIVGGLPKLGIPEKESVLRTR